MTPDLLSRSQFQFKPKHAPHPDSALRTDGTTHQFNKASAHHQADPRPLPGTGLPAKAVEGLEQLRELLR